MVFQEGNQLSKGLTNNGAPAKYDIDKMAKKLDEWSRHPTSIQLLDFCADNDFSAKYLSRWSKVNDDFREALDRAKSKIGARRERAVNFQQLDVRVFNRYQGMYDASLNEHEREEKAFEYELKKGLENKTTSFVIQPTDYSKACND